MIVEVATRGAWYAFAGRLRARGFVEDTSEGAPICRWVVGDVRVDVMPTEEEILSFKNRWYAEASPMPCRSALALR